MTLTELKSLKVGQIVKYTNDVDAFNIGYWEVIAISIDEVSLMLPKSNSSATIRFDEEDIEHTASMLTIDQPIAYKALEPQRQLKLIEAKIRDAEFDLECMYRLQHADTMSGKVPHETLKGQFDILAKMIQDLEKLRQQRNELIEKI